MQAFKRFFREQRAIIPNSEHLPSYKLLEMIIVAGIEAQLWKAGDPLPPERKLAEACECSVGTVKRAMLELVHQGLLFRRQGSGTYVAGTSFNRQHRKYFLFLKDFNRKEAENAVTLHSLQRIPAVASVNSALELPLEEELFEVTRLFSEDGKKCALARSFLSAARFADLDRVPRARLEHVPLFILLEEDYEVTSVHTDELFSAVLADEGEAAMLEVPAGAPLLKIKSLVFTPAGKPFEYRISLCRTDEKSIFRTMEQKQVV